MFVLNDDNSIYVTRGDGLYFDFYADNGGKNYKFQPGDVLQISVAVKKDMSSVVLQKRFPVEDYTEKVRIYLTKRDTRIGGVISKPTDYWYQIRLNPDDETPQSIISYDEDGPKLFRLFPEIEEINEPDPAPEDIPIVDQELDMTSTRPVGNQAISRAYQELLAGYERTHAAVAKLHVTPQMFGAIGDGVADDTEAFKAVIENAVAAATGDVWKSIPKIYIPRGTYLISEALLNDEKYEACKFIFEGDSYTNTTIKVAAGCPVLFPNNDIYGFTQFSNITFEGADSTQTFMEVLSGATGNAQSMYFHRCAFRKFHTVLKLGKAEGVTVGTMTSETLISECKISNCGTTDNPCELFVLDNQQSVNNRFYATDIESFVGVLFKYKEGNSIAFYQGSIIPLSGSTIVDGTELDGNKSGSGNQPSLAMWGCRFELRGNTKLLNHGTNWGSLFLSFNECGMGCANLDEGVIPITISGTGNAKIFFTRCRNARTMYCEFVNLNSNTTRDAVLSKVHFEECDINVLDFVEHSTLTFNGNNKYIAHPEIKIDGVYYNLDKDVRNAPLGNHLRLFERCLLDGENYNGFGCGSSSKSATYTVPICSYIREITLINLGNATYSGYTTNKMNCAIYNEDDVLIGSIDGIAVSGGNGAAAIKRYVKTLKFVFSTDMANAPTLPIVALAKIIA